MHGFAAMRALPRVALSSVDRADVLIAAHVIFAFR
jgi:hypothetical protein